MAKRDTSTPIPYPEGRPEDGVSEEAQTGALIDCIMGVPVSPDRGYPGEAVASLRSQVEALHAEGIMVDIPWSGEAPDLEEYPETRGKSKVPENSE
jgi:hypothetical protein